MENLKTLSVDFISKNRRGISLLIISLVLLVVFSTNALDKKNKRATNENWQEFVQRSPHEFFEVEEMLEYLDEVARELNNWR